MNMYVYSLLISFVFLLVTSRANAANYLQECWDRQGRPVQQQLMQFHYEENQNLLYHSPEPWQVRNSKSTGSVWCNAEHFFQSDTITAGEKAYVSKMQVAPNELLIQNYWRKELAAVTESMVADQPFEIARYSPTMLLNYFLQHQSSAESTHEANCAVYTLTMNKTIVKLYIRTTDFLLEKVTTTQNNDILGDVKTTLTYSDFASYKKLFYARTVQVEKLHGIRDSISISAVALVESITPLVEKPAGYSVGKDAATNPEVQVEKINNHIYFLNFPQTQSKATLVEFRDFFVVVDAPFNSKNGELIIGEAQKIAPDKPVRYYTFGHHHPWYIGGVRSFIHHGTTILCTEKNIPYLQFIASAPHTLQPDSLQMQPKELVTKVLDSTTTISDGNFEMNIYWIGGKSKHTNDYLLFYFPSEKLLLEGDLAWIPKDGVVQKASSTQRALYNAIKELGIPVQTVSQSWPVSDAYAVKSMFSFEELEQSIHLK